MHVNAKASGPGADALFAAADQKEARRQSAWLDSRVKTGQECVFAEAVAVSPVLAEILLQRNKSETYTNRPATRQVVDRYARLMTEGAWALTGEPIILSASGNLLNGQHRLMGCVKAGVAFPTLMVFGIADDAFAFMDIGKTRSAADLFGIHGVPQASLVAGANMWLWRHEHCDMGSPSTVNKPTNEELYEYYLANNEIAKSLTVGGRFHVCKLASPSLMTALHCLCARRNRQQADDFFEKVATGINLTAREPATKLRDKLIEGKTGAVRIPDIYIAAFTVQAWNAVRTRQPIKIFRWRGDQNPDQPFPGIV